MSRSGYSDDCDGWEFIMWRGAVESAIRGRRGQALLKDMLAALDAMPEKRLIANHIAANGEVCALGCVGRVKGVNMDKVDPYDYESVAKLFGIAPALAQEIMFINDEWGSYNQTPEERWQTVREWVERHIKPVVKESLTTSAENGA